MDALNSCVDMDTASDQLTLETITINTVDSDESIKVHYVLPASENINVIPETQRPTGLLLGATSNLISNHVANDDIHCSFSSSEDESSNNPPHPVLAQLYD